MFNKYKNHLKILPLCLIILISAITADAQKKNTAKALKIGDTIPDLAIKNFLNAPGKIVRFKDLHQSKLLIIDFWATWCVPCIREMGKLDSLKQKFGSRLSVLPVGYEDSLVIKKFFVKNKDIPHAHLDIITNDKVLDQYFPHYGIPHNIWVSSDGVVRAITNSEEISEENIENFLKSNQLKLPEKKDNLAFDYTQPFHLADSSFTYRSIISPFIPGIPGGTADWGTAGKGNYRFFAFNMGMLDLFWEAHTMHHPGWKIDLRQVKIVTQDSLKFFMPFQIHNKALTANFKREIDWNKKYAYCYDLTLPKLTPITQFYEYIIQDLMRYFNVQYKVEYKEMLCNVVRTTPISKYSLSNFQSVTDSIPSARLFKNTIILRHSTLKKFMVDVLSNFNQTDNLWVDETGINIPFDIQIELNKNQPINMSTIKTKLQEYGIIVKTETHLYPIMVLTDLN